MQTVRQPFLLGRSTKPRSTQSGTVSRRIRSPSSCTQAIDDFPGAIHFDGLLFGRHQASSFALHHTATHDGDDDDDDRTFVQPSPSFQFCLPVHLEEDEVADSDPVSYFPSHASAAQPASSNNAVTDVPKHSSLSFDVHNHHAHSILTPTRRRVLTHSLNSDREAMNSIIASIPGSPPDLTDSRSSKSSSSDSNFSTSGDVSGEITNFEDIGLGDEQDGSKLHNPQHASRPASAARRAEMNEAPYYRAQRQKANNRLQQTPSRPAPLNQRPSTLGALTRGLTSPSTTTIATYASRQRSTSPAGRLPRSASTMSLTTASVMTGRSPRTSFGPASRRGSWQQRKTAKEIEADYHDSDDELPEDASLWNVPISPFPANYRSTLSSARGSPERSPACPPAHPLPLPLDHSHQRPASPPRRSPASPSVPRNRLTTRSSANDLTRLTAISPRMPTLARNGRAKSWNVALSDLSAEARIVSQHLEIHAECAESPAEDKYKDKWLPPIPHRSSAPSAIQLPPVQRGTLDFMPISKEKEAILSRTRPSWLPPKDPKEEKKHLKEYQRMMAASIEAEKKKESQLNAVLSKQDETFARINRIWDYYIEPNTDIVTLDRRVYDLCWRGIPARVRGKVWQRTIGNPLGLSAKTYTRALTRARDLKAKDPQHLGPHEQNMLKSFADIERDAETAFTELKVFQKHGPLWQDLVNLCEAHACYRSDVGYFYGVQLIGALLLLQVPNVAEAFVLLENSLNNPIPHAFQTGDIASTQRTYNRVISTLQIKFPRLHNYLFGAPERDGLGLTGEEVLGIMFRTMFSNGLSMDQLSRVWDIWVFEGDRSLVRTAVAVLGSLQHQIFDIEGDLELKRRNVQEMLGWGPFNRTEHGSYWRLPTSAGDNGLVDEIRMAGQLDYTGR